MNKNFSVRYILRLISAFLNRFKALIIVSIVFGIAAFFVVKLVIPIISGTQVTKIGVTGRFTTNSIPPEILAKISNGLTKLDVDGNPEPDLAQSWETTDKGKTWIFTLKDGLVWQDGKSIKSSEIAYNFSDVSIEYPDDKTIIFKLQSAYSAFPVVVSKPVFLQGLLGTGEWKVKKLSLNGAFVEQILLEAEGERENYKFYPTEERTKLAFKLGQVEVVADLLDPTPLDSWNRVNVTKESNKGEYVAIFLNTQDEFLSDKTIRQALSYAINKSDFAEEKAISPIPDTSWAYNPLVKPYTFDKEKAQSIIDDYKEASGKDEITLTLATTSVLLKRAERIAKYWEDIGIKVNIQVFSVVPTDYQALLAIFDVPDDPDQYSLWHSTQTSTNITHYQNPRIDKLLEDGRTEISLEKRREIYLDFQRFLVEDSPAIFLYYPNTYRIGR